MVRTRTGSVGRTGVRGNVLNRPARRRAYGGRHHGRAMKFGIAIFPTDYAISIAELAPAVEERGFESLWVAEHSHIPASRETPFPGGGELPKHYSHTLDPFVALTAAAAATTSLKVA